ncbi:TetR/AcrR family transcriptional regulator [Yinghuangia sp. ASG 101]|uniref:TetR/AcrR family transcriptional regulator n=1 Tax=Yinghuangia sp. ASG 101 TaxID=2896848 RepID=UPI001E5CA84B|nr:TetR/AcrR family transcriptional regulator [Yinghuangia sp. ASG 101]UGQ13134.1 TetR/AcrR family transcriptional regulator [Yinghuangia sp. ASG 101]
MPAPRRTRLTPDQRRAQLLRLGRELLATRTLDELSVDELAERAGISRGLMFHYFKSKQGFQRAVVEAACADFLERTAPDTALEPFVRLRAVLGAFVDYVLDHRATYVSLVRGAASADATVRELVDGARGTQAARLLAGCAEFGLDDSPTLRAAARAWVVFAEETVIAWQDPEEDRGRLAEFLERTLMAVLACVDPAAETLSRA